MEAPFWYEKKHPVNDPSGAGAIRLPLTPVDNFPHYLATAPLGLMDKQVSLKFVFMLANLKI
jgi:hypothetical protein